LPIALGLVGAPRPGWRTRLAWIALPTSVALLVLSPWTIRNYYEFHRFIPTRTGLGQAVFEGSGGAATDEAAAAAVHRDDPTARYGTPKYDDVLLRKAARLILDDPWLYLRRVLHRARYLLPCLLIVLVWRRWKKEALMLAAVALATIVPYLFVGDDTRFYLPAAFAYLILGAMASSVIVSHVFRWSGSLWNREAVAARFRGGSR
jgi:hypothetical protein